MSNSSVPLTLGDIHEDENVFIIVHELEVENILAAIENEGPPHYYGFLAMKIDRGDYTHIWASESSIPYLSAYLDVLLEP